MSEFSIEQLEQEAELLDGQADDACRAWGGETIPSMSARGRAAMLRYAVTLRRRIDAAESALQRIALPPAHELAEKILAMLAGAQDKQLTARSGQAQIPTEGK